MTSDYVFRGILEVLAASDKPLSSAEIAKQMTKYSLTANETGGLLRTLESEGKVRRIFVKHLNRNVWEIADSRDTEAEAQYDAEMAEAEAETQAMEEAEIAEAEAMAWEEGYY